MKTKTLLAVFFLFWLAGKPSMGLEKEISSYRVGELLLPETVVRDSSLHPLKLLELLSWEARVVVVVLFGGGAKRLDPTKSPRGGLWCPDSYRELRLHQELLRTFRNRPVQFIAIAVPPVFGSATFGYQDGIFLRTSSSLDYLVEARSFIRATRKASERGALPFPNIYFDPRFELGRTSPATSGVGHPEAAWRGKLKWHLDERKYGLPTLWLLNPRGEILREPFYGNDYTKNPPELRYDFTRVKVSIQELLDR